MRRAVGKENAVEMVDLVAEAAGGKTGAFDLKRVAVPILCADFDMVRTLDDAVRSGRLRQPSPPSCSPSRSTISGFTSSIKYSSSPSGTLVSITMQARRIMPTCGAARPTPFACESVSFISSSS